LHSALEREREESNASVFDPSMHVFRDDSSFDPTAAGTESIMASVRTDDVVRVRIVGLSKPGSLTAILESSDAIGWNCKTGQ
jgi:hypothetical protein